MIVYAKGLIDMRLSQKFGEEGLADVHRGDWPELRCQASLLLVCYGGPDGVGHLPLEFHEERQQHRSLEHGLLNEPGRVQGAASDLLPDTKTPEDPAEQVLGCELAGDLAERLLRAAQFLGDEFAALVGEQRAGGIEVAAGAGERI